MKLRSRKARLTIPGACRHIGILSLTLALGVCAAPAGKAPEIPPLTTISGNPRLPGKFVWADLVTDDVSAAQKFYSQLFGWRFLSYGNYVIAMNEERPLCGIFHRARPADNPQGKPRWFGYISVADVRKAVSTVTNAGGRVLAAPQKVPKRGEQAVFADPEGAIFGVVRSSAGDPQDFLADPGDWIWIQLLCRDGKKASEFYKKVAGYEVVENTNPNRLNDYVLTSKGYARATVRTLAEKSEVKPNWLPFVRVKSISDAVKKAEELGGKILIAPNTALFDGKIAAIADPTGAAIGVLEWDETLVKGTR